MKKVLDFCKKNVIQIVAIVAVLLIVIVGMTAHKIINYAGNSDTIDTYSSDKVEIDPENSDAEDDTKAEDDNRLSDSNTLSSLKDKELTAEEIDKSAEEALNSVKENIQQNSGAGNKQAEEGNNNDAGNTSEETKKGDNSGSGNGKKNDDTSDSRYKTCTLSITCYPFLDDCSDAIRAELPRGGGILTSAEVEFQEGDTVYDILERACRAKGIQYTVKQTVYGTYVSSLDNLSERYYDNSTGWMYFVDGADPGVSSSQLEVTDGMNIVWSYDSWSF